MVQKNKTFLKILVIELEDLDEDIKTLITECDDKYDKNIISDYVHNENLAVLQNEFFGVESFLEDIKKTDPEGFSNLDDLKKYLLDNLHQRIHKMGFAHSIMNLVERKMDKVIKYLSL